MRKYKIVTVTLKAKIPVSIIEKEIKKLAEIGVCLFKYNWYIPKNGIKIK